MAVLWDVTSCISVQVSKVSVEAVL